jgi:hypothetical protein
MVIAIQRICVTTMPRNANRNQMNLANTMKRVIMVIAQTAGAVMGMLVRCAIQIGNVTLLAISAIWMTNARRMMMSNADRTVNASLAVNV